MSRKPSSAAIAKDRLRIILKTERGVRDGPRYLPALSRELRDLVQRHIHVAGEDVRITIDEVDGQEVLELFVRLPEDAGSNEEPHADGDEQEAQPPADGIEPGSLP